MRNLLPTLTVLALVSAPALAQEAPPLAVPKTTTLEISASADISAAPDMATIGAGVMTQAPTAAEALSKNAAAMNKLFAALKALGIDAKDIQTSGLSVNPQFVYRENQAPTVTSYQASNNVNVHLTKLDTVGSVIDALVKQGANQISGPTFGIDKPDPLLDNARKEAITKARARAELLAGAAGLHVGRIVSITESASEDVPAPRPMMRTMAMAASAPPTPVSEGELSLTANVTMVFELTP